MNLKGSLVHDRINSSGQCVGLEDRLKVTEGLGEQTVHGNPQLPGRGLTVTVKNHQESSGTSGRPQSRADGTGPGGTDTFCEGSWQSV